MIYLDNAATTMPKPETVLNACQDAILKGGNPGRSGHEPAIYASSILYECRKSLSRFFHTVDPLRYVFTLSATDALNTVIQGVAKPGGHYIVTENEHNAVLRCVYAMCKAQGCTMSLLKCSKEGYIEPDELYRIARPETVLCIVNHASNVTGAVQDIEGLCRICHNLEIPILIDAAQSAGSVEIDIGKLRPDAVSLPGHKGLLGIQGCGALYLGEGINVRPLRQGGTGSYSFQLEQPEELPDKYESGTLPTPAVASLKAGIQYVEEHFTEIKVREKKLTKDLWDGLSEIGEVTLYGPEPAKPRVGVVLFTLINMNSAQAATLLWERYGIACRSGLHCAPLIHNRLGTGRDGAIRLSIGPFTTQNEIEETIRAVKELAALR